MIEKLVTSKTRIKILNLFLSHIDDRYYLRELERLLDESLSPLRRQLLKLTSMGILITEEEANLKYYRLNKNFEGLEELKELVLGKEAVETQSTCQVSQLAHLTGGQEAQAVSTPRQFRYDLAILSFVSVFVLATAMFVVYTNNKNVKLVAGLVSKNTSYPAASRLPIGTQRDRLSNGEMVSKKWKVTPDNVPVLSNVEAGEDKKSKEL